MTTGPNLQPQESSTVVEKPRFPWRLFWLLAAMTILATLLILPYALKLAAIGATNIEGPANSKALVVFSSLLQTVLLYWPLAFIGLLLSRKLGLGLPYLQAVSEGRPAPSGFRRVLLISVAAGLALGALILLLAGLFGSFLPPEMTEISLEEMPNALEGFMASIAAGINEEILLRLFLLTLFAWIIQRIARRPDGRPNKAVLWTANILAAVIFGLLHLPNLTVMGIGITPVLILYVILLNGLGGMGFGYLYWTYGLEAAMLAHFSADIVLHVIPQLLGPLTGALK